MNMNNKPEASVTSSSRQDNTNRRKSDNDVRNSQISNNLSHSTNSSKSLFGSDDKHLNLSQQKSDGIQSLIPQSLLKKNTFNRYQGDLYKSCPCKPGLACDNGICKQEPGSSCVTSSACHSSMMCYIGRCTEQPKTPDEKSKTNYHDGTVCVNRHFMKMEQDRFIMMKGWWSMSGGVSICDSDVSGLVYMVREDGVTRVSTDPSISGFIKIEQSLSLLKLFRFLGKVYGLTTNGKMYQLISENLKTKWKYRPVKEIYKKALSRSVIEDVYPCRDGSVSLRIEGKIHTYSIKTKKWVEEIGPKKIIYGETSDTKITLYSDRIEFKFVMPDDDITNRRHAPLKSHKPKQHGTTYTNFTFTLTGIYKDVELNTEGDGIIVLVAKTGHVKECKPVIWLHNTSWSSNSSQQTHFRERLLHGTGDQLLRTSNTIWMLTGAKCLQV